MARTANHPLQLPKGVEVKLDPEKLSIKGGKGSLAVKLDADVDVKHDGTLIRFSSKHDTKHSRTMAGTLRALVRNMLDGVTQGYQKKLELQGVGYRAQAQGRKLNLTLGFSHPINMKAPDGIDFEVPQPTEIIVRGIDKQLVGETAAQIRRHRPPEPYKGKGVRYADEQVRRKVGKRA